MSDRARFFPIAFFLAFATLHAQVFDNGSGHSQMVELRGPMHFHPGVRDKCFQARVVVANPDITAIETRVNHLDSTLSDNLYVHIAFCTCLAVSSSDPSKRQPAEERIYRYSAPAVLRTMLSVRRARR